MCALCTTVIVLSERVNRVKRMIVGCHDGRTNKKTGNPLTFASTFNLANR